MATAIEKDEKKILPATSEPRTRASATQFARETRAELNKVSWPTREHVTQSILLILVIISFFTVIIASSDGLFVTLLSSLQKL